MSNAFYENWPLRMGIHQAYHTNTHNKIAHWILIPLEIYGVVSLLAALPTIVEWALLFAIATVYLSTNLSMGASFVCFVLGLRALRTTPLAGLIFFIIPFLAQTMIAHKYFEPNGRDDTEKNVNEFKQTKNPVPLLLIFYYHWVELFFLCGFFLDLNQQVEKAKQNELMKKN